VLDLPLTVGGRTALEQQGYAHYLSTAMREVHLYGPKRPPTGWRACRSIDLSLAQQPAAVSGDADAPPEPSPVMVSAGGLTLPIRYSSKERAVLELLDELPEHESFHQADALMEGMSDLSLAPPANPAGACASVKVKRLFLFFADRHRHAAILLDMSRVDLGSGKRVLVKGGKLDPRYNITVPSDLGGP
jgi:hypothetical protein